MITKRLSIILVIASLLLLIPLVAMQFSDEVDWDLRDFIIAGILLYGTGMLLELVLQKFKSKLSRIIFCGLVLLILFLIWAELAVGVFGSPFAGS